jgi:adenylate cyclase
MEIERRIRRLAAVFFADVVGFSRLMAEDENNTLSVLNAFREEEFDPVIARYNGRIVKLMGDGTLVEFGSVFDAVDCAVAIQTILAQADRARSLQLRIGVNLGDIILQGDDIYGDGVNIAARLEPQAKPGGVCISTVVQESIRNRPGAQFTDCGDIEVKNISRPVRIWRWHPDDTATTREPAAATPAPNRAPDAASIAVLPFDNMSGDKEQDYFSDGISEDIITDLSKVPGLLVIARNSSFAYKGKSVDLRTVGRELGVGHVLEGSVRRAGDSVRITAQLIDAATGGHLWADRYDRDLTDIFAVQDEVTLNIVEALKIRLTPAQKAKIASTGSTNPEAYDLFLRMRDLTFSPGINEERWDMAQEYGRQACELDPSFAQAPALMSIFHAMASLNGWGGGTPAEVLARGKELAERAVAIDAEDPLANIAFGTMERFGGDIDVAARMIAKAASVTPDAGLVLFLTADVALVAGRPQDAVPVLERAIRLDPAWSHQHLQFLGIAHFLMGNFETAALVFAERLVLMPGTDIGRAWLAASLGHTGQLDESRKIWAELIEIDPGFDIKSRLARFGFLRPQDPASVLAGLSKAGLDF